MQSSCSVLKPPGSRDNWVGNHLDKKISACGLGPSETYSYNHAGTKPGKCFLQTDPYMDSYCTIISWEHPESWDYEAA